MIFSSFQFFIFLLTVLGLVAILPNTRYRKLLLLAASYYFYAYWDHRFTALIFASTLVDFTVGRLLHKANNQTYRNLLLAVSIVFNLGLLGFFKYYNFFADSAAVILSNWGLGISTVEIILPVGISFYTFQTMSYIIDVYREQLEPVDSFVDFALFVAFFPQLVAGPIVRAADFLPQLQRPIELKTSNLWFGSQIFMVGLFKKLMIADAVSPFVDQVYVYPDYYSSLTVWLAGLAYGLQIYCDFSGYSDMAIGCARMFGFHFERNFFMPYLSQNITEFWRRWHISLSTWLRDYLYISLGGNRKGWVRTYINLMITMILGGLWHGASWNFVIWGTLHGFALAFHKLWSARFKQGGYVLQIISGIVTFLFVMLAWVLFRAHDTRTMLAVYDKLFFIEPFGASWYYRATFMAFALALLGHLVGIWRTSPELVFFETPYSYRVAFAVTSVLLIIYVFAPTNVSPFIYFQF